MPCEVVVPIKSDSDDREYRVVTLENKARVILVSDKETDKSGAAMAVGVGSSSDPLETQGLAHFLEHMLFLGTEKYPDENSYSAALNKYGGSLNAWTDKEMTNYFFDVTPDHLEEILDRFSQFFIAPLFTPSATDREMNAVNSEHQKNIQNDSWREFQMIKQALNPKHPYSQFSTGDINTLDVEPKAQGVNVREYLLKFHEEHYSANLMTICVYGKEDLDQLQEWAVKYFTPIPNTDKQYPVFDKDVSDLVENAKFVYEMIPVGDRRKLKLHWFVDSDYEHWKSNPLGLLSHLLGDEGPGSVLAHLKTLGWAEELSAGANKGMTATSFSVVISLTSEGLSKIPEILQVIYAYLAMIKEADDDEIERVHTEMVKLDEITFKFASKLSCFDYVSNLTQQLHEYDAENVMKGAYVQPEYNLDLFRTYLDQFTVNNCIIQVIAKEVEKTPTKLASFARVDIEKEWDTEKYYGIKYFAYPLTVTDVSKLKNAKVTDLALPPKNPFIAENFTVHTDPEADVTLPVYEGVPADFPLTGIDDLFVSSLPFNAISLFSDLPLTDLVIPKTEGFRSESVKNTANTKADDLSIGPTVLSVPLPDGPWLPVVPVVDPHVNMIDKQQPVELWYKLDRFFGQPKVVIKTLIQSTLSYATPRVHMLNSLIALVASESLSEELYAATVAGLNYYISATFNGLEVTVVGYNDKAGQLSRAIVERIRTLPVVLTPQLFEIEKDRLLRKLMDSLKAPAYVQARYNDSFTLSSPIFHTHEKIAILQTLTAQDLFSFVNPYFSSGRIVMSVHGNMVQKEAIRLAQATVAVCMMKPPTLSELQFQRRCVLPNKSIVCQWPQGNIDDHESAIVNTYQTCGGKSGGMSDYCTISKGELLTQIISDSVYDTLRTKQQLGYIVWCYGAVQGEGYNINFIVQSSQSPLHVDGRIEAFINTDLIPYLENLSEEDFKANVTAKLATLQAKDDTLAEVASRHWNKITNHTYDWNRALKCCEYISKFTKEDIIDFAKTYLLIDSPNRAKLSTQVIAKKHVIPPTPADYVYPVVAEDSDLPNPPTDVKVTLMDPRQIGMFKKSLCLSGTMN